MKRFLAFALGVAMSTAALAQDDDPPAYDLSCHATREFGCSATSCESEEADHFYVGVTILSSAGTGSLCTFTYCRDFMLVPRPCDTVDEAVGKWTGFTLSESRGSTEEHIGRPAIDYQLSISEDRRHFVLVDLEDGRFSGWGGPCEAPAQE